MSTVTLDDIKATQNKLAAMIAAFEKQPVFPITIAHPELKPGEQFVGAIVSADGSKRHALILLPGEIEKADWEQAKAWAANLGGELPDRVESALLFATMKDEFKPEWHWTREQHAADSDYAWVQFFLNGGLNSYRKSWQGRARAVRRLEIQ